MADAKQQKDATGSHGGHEAETPHDPLDSTHLVMHVKDADYFELPGHTKLKIPQLLKTEKPLYELTEQPIEGLIEPLDLKVTKFMVLEVVGAAIIAFVFIGLAKRIKEGKPAAGRFWNLLEVILLYIRDEVARPAIGKHDAHQFMPFVWTLFFFVLTCNLLGMVPWLGSPTGALATTGTMALITFAVVTGAGMKKLGIAGFWKAQVPHMDVPGPLLIVLWPAIFLIEIMGLLIKHFVLSVRLLANMMAGHLVLGVIMAFIAASAKAGFAIWLGVSVASIGGATALSMLELFVAFLQAYIFTFLASLFIGMAVHPH